MLAALLADLLLQYGGSQQMFARVIGISPSTLSHLLSGAPQYRIGTEVCLRIAAVTRTDPSRLLRAAGKDDVADLLTRLYGAVPVRARDTSVSPADQRLLAQLKALDRPTLRAVLYLITRLSVIAGLSV